MYKVCEIVSYQVKLGCGNRKLIYRMSFLLMTLLSKIHRHGSKCLDFVTENIQDHFIVSMSDRL